MPKITVHGGASNAAADAELAAQDAPAEVDVETPDTDDDNVDVDGDGEVTGYETWTKAQLTAELERRELPKTGAKADLVRLLLEDDDAAAGQGD